MSFKVGVCCICERAFRPRRSRMETLIYCSAKCCAYTSVEGPRPPPSAKQDAILHREWDAVQWAQNEAKKFDDEPLAERLLA